MRHFSFKEMIRSATAGKQGIDNMPKEVGIIDNLDLLIEQVLEPLRVAMGFPVVISSGYRCKELNKAVGGVTNSLHMQGRAADINCGKVRNQLIYDWLKAGRDSGALPISELLWEQSGTWVHVAI